VPLKNKGGEHVKYRRTGLCMRRREKATGWRFHRKMGGAEQDSGLTNSKTAVRKTNGTYMGKKRFPFEQHSKAKRWDLGAGEEPPLDDQGFVRDHASKKEECSDGTKKFGLVGEHETLGGHARRKEVQRISGRGIGRGKSKKIILPKKKDSGDIG